MFCSGCGRQLQSGLNYCSGCGRRVAEDLAKASWELNPLTITACMAGVGFFCFILLVRILSRSDVPANILVPISFAYFGALFGISFLVLRFGSKFSSTNATSREGETGEVDGPAYLRPGRTTAQLQEARDLGIGSVTDATTRTLEKSAIERK